MKLAGASVLSISALLLAAVVHSCPTLKASGKKYVVGGKTSYYKVGVATGTTAVGNATLKISLPDGVEYISSAIWPKRGAPSQSVADVTWSGLSLAARKRYSFRVKVDVDACAPDELDFEANINDGGSCDVDAATVTTTVNRAKKAPPCPPLPVGVCNATALTTTNGKAVYSCGAYSPCGEVPFVVVGLQDCLDNCSVNDNSYGIYFEGRPNNQCMCQTKANFDSRGLRISLFGNGYAIGQNPATLPVSTC